MLALAGHYIILVHLKILISLDSALVVWCATGFNTLVMHQIQIAIFDRHLSEGVQDALRLGMVHFITF